MNPLKQTWMEGSVIEYREIGSTGMWWLSPPVWDESRYEYREYRPLNEPIRELNPAKQQAVDLANRRIAGLRTAQQHEMDRQVFRPPPLEQLEPTPVKWVLIVLFSIALATAAYGFAQFVLPELVR